MADIDIEKLRTRAIHFLERPTDISKYQGWMYIRPAERDAIFAALDGARARSEMFRDARDLYFRECERLRKALEFYADPTTYDCGHAKLRAVASGYLMEYQPKIDGGAKAREALAATGGIKDGDALEPTSDKLGTVASPAGGADAAGGRLRIEPHEFVRSHSEGSGFEDNRKGYEICYCGRSESDPIHTRALEQHKFRVDLREGRTTCVEYAYPAGEFCDHPQSDPIHAVADTPRDEAGGALLGILSFISGKRKTELLLEQVALLPEVEGFIDAITAHVIAEMGKRK